MRPYSVDFRQKIIDVWKKEKISIRGLAQRFDVAKSFIQKLLKQHKETGDIRPRPQGGSPPTKLNSEQLIILIEIIESNNDATLEELSDLLYEKTQVKVSRATLGRLTQKLNYSFKKKHYTRRKKKVTGCSKKECNTGPKFGKLRHQN
jgi:transposase